MGNHHLRGMAICRTQVLRDEYFSRFEDYLDSTINVIPWDDPQGELPTGIVKFGNRVGVEISGPAFSVSLRVDDAHYLDPPQGDGSAGALAEELNDHPDIEFEYSVVGPI